jgi:hypothetical protein
MAKSAGLHRHGFCIPILSAAVIRVSEKSVMGSAFDTFDTVGLLLAVVALLTVWL